MKIERENFIGFIIPEKTKKRIEKLVKAGKFQSRSHFAREAVDEKLKQEETK